MPVQVSALRSTPTVASEPFLRIPPFPGSTVHCFAEVQGQQPSKDCAAGDLNELVRKLRVGGTYWGAQPDLPPEYLLVRSPCALRLSENLTRGLPIVLWTQGDLRLVAKEAHIVVTGECDPWHMLSGAAAVVADGLDEVASIAALLDVPVYMSATPADGLQRQDLSSHIDEIFADAAYCNPFSNEALSVRDAIELCGFWRRLIDSNRGICGGIGFAFWKRENVGTLLWDGSRPFRFLSSISDIEPRGSVAVWRSKAPPEAMEMLEARNIAQVEVEDGFLRSQGLGADCVPPLSITADRRGAYFDPSQPSDLECLIQGGAFDPHVIDRAARLRRAVVDSGLSKYGCGDESIHRRVEGRRHILVPGQVEDDRSVQTGGCGLSTNLDLLIRVREQAPDAYILYKPHPDVAAGHRRGAVANRDCLRYADEIVTDAPIASLIAMVDEVHVNTSLTGFEALIREKPVTTYGVPFYAGWGLTCDLGPVPVRRSARRTLDEIVAATLLLYPRYLDPLTGLPCPPEVVVSRLISESQPDPGLVVTMRRLQGKLMRSVRSLVE